MLTMYSASNGIKSTLDRRVTGGFVQKVIQDVSLALCTAIPLSGRLLVCFIIGQLPLLATFEIDILFPGVWLRMSQSFYRFAI